MATSTNSSVITIDPEIMGGEPVFRGTRVPISTLFEALAGGDPLSDFLEGVARIRPDQAKLLLAEAMSAVLARAQDGEVAAANGTAGSPSVISVDPEILWGRPVFRGTRVPVETLFDYLMGGEPLSEFLIDFPTVAPQQVKDLFDEALAALTSGNGPHPPR